MPRSFLIICLALFLLGNSSRAQEVNKDSIRQLLENVKSDTAKVTLLLHLTEELPEGYWQQLNDTLLNFLNLKIPGAPAVDRGKYLAALGAAYNNKSIDLKYKGDTEQALQFGEKALAIFRENNDDFNVANAYYNNGRLYNSLGHIGKAITNLNKSLRLYEQLGKDENRVYNLNMLGNIYKDQLEFDKSRESHMQALTVATRIHDKQATAFSIACLGQLYATEKNYDSATVYFKKHIQAYKDLHIDQDLATGYFSMGTLLKSQRRYAGALENYNTALALYKKINDTNGRSKTVISIGDVYLLQGDYGKARQFLTEGLAHARQLGYPKDVQFAADGLYRLYKHTGQKDEALVMLELSKKMNDSIQSTNTNRAVLKSQYKYEYEKKSFADSVETAEQHILLEARLQQARTERYLFITGAALIIVLAGFIYQRVRVNQKLNELRFRNEVANDLHDDLGSALSSISIFSEVAKRKLETRPEEASDAVNEIGHISRSILEEMSDIVWAISPRNDSIKVLKEKMESFGRTLLVEAGIEFRFNVDDHIENLKLPMECRKNLYLIFKEGINNAAKYSNAKQIDVNLKAIGKDLQLSVSDNGIGFNEEVIKKGNGLKNMKERAKEIGAIFEIRSAINGGTLLQLNLKTT